MPPIVANPVISFLRHRAHTEEYGYHAGYRYPPRNIRNHKSFPSRHDDMPLDTSPGVPRGTCNRIPLLSKRRLRSLPRVAGACVAARPALRCVRPKNSREGAQWPGQPRPSLRSASASRSTGISRLSSDSDPFGSDTHRPRPRFGGGGRFSAMELPLPDMPLGMGGRCARAAADPGKSCGHRRRGKLVIDQCVPRPSPTTAPNQAAPSAR